MHHLVLFLAILVIVLAGCCAARLLRPRNNLFVLTGPPGAGKTTLLGVAAALEQEFDVAVFLKYAMRTVSSGRVAGPLDSIPVAAEEFVRRRQALTFWTYGLLREEWGFDIRELRRTCEAHRNTLITIISPDVIRRVAHALPRVRVIPVFIYSDAARRSQRIAQDNNSVEAQDFRSNRSALILLRYQEDPYLYAHVLVNVGDQETFRRHVRQLLQRYNSALPFRHVPHAGPVGGFPPASTAVEGVRHG